MPDAPNSGKALVFISCGQLRAEEIELGQSLARMVNAIDGLEAYFAQDQISFEGVSRNIFAALNRCVAFVAVMHDRGDVTHVGAERTWKRASVWIEQEIAIASFIQNVLERNIEPIIYLQRGIEREGLRDKLLLNVIEFTSEADVVADFLAYRVPRLKGLATTSKEREPNLRSPLGHIQFPVLTLEPQPVNPDFIVGVHVTPWSYATAAPPFDAARVEQISQILQAAEPAAAWALTPKTEKLGVRFATPEPRERRQDGAPRQPARQLFISRDGSVTLRFDQNDGSPFEQIIATLHEAYALSKALFDSRSAGRD